jgi:uncharacterized membrane protein
MIKKFFLSGLRTFLPLALTVAVVFWILNSLENIFEHLLLFFIPPHYYVWGMGIIAGVLCIFTLGIFVNFWLGQQFSLLVDRLVDKIPLIKTIYTAFRDVSDYFDSKKSHKGSQVVMADLPHIGKVIGIVMRDEIKSPVLADHLEQEDCCIVYFPMSYQIGGYSIIMARKNLTPLDFTVEQGLRFAMTAGVNYKDH